MIACEASQEVCKAFRALGHNAFSCDIEPCYGGHPEWHIQTDIRNVIWYPQWDLIIAHPPCTYLCKASAVRMYDSPGVINEDRYRKAMIAKEFFYTILLTPCKHICIENPIPLKVVNLPKESQRIQPYQFGEPYSKLTYLWLKGLPLLKPTNILTDYKPYVSSNTSHNKGMKNNGYSRSGGAAKIRSRTFPGIAAAMAQQWSEYLMKEGV